MSWFESVSPSSRPSDAAKPLDTAAMVQLGALSPLWMLFLGASTAGMAYWGMTRWMRLAAPELAVGNVVKLRLVKPQAPSPASTEPSAPSIDVAPAPVIAPEPAPIMAPEPVKLAATPKPAKATKPKALKSTPPKVEPQAAPIVEKPAAKRGRPPKVRPEAPAVQPEAPVSAEVAPAAPKATGAKRGPKPKPKG